MEDQIQNNKLFNLGYVFKPTTRTASKILILICLLGGCAGFTNEAPYMGVGAVLIILLCILLVNYKSSIEINIQNNKFRECGRFFFYKSGKWRNFSSYTDIAILTTRKTIKNEINIGVNAGVSTYQDSVSYNEKETAIYLLTQSHRHRVLIQVCDNYRVAEIFAEELANELDKTYTIFNPRISQASKNKRNRH
jgi:hypothetical protein